MKKTLIILFFFMATALPIFVQAQGGILKPDKQTEFNDNIQQLASSTDYSTQDTLDAVLGRIIRTVLSVLGSVFLILMFFAGWLWMRASGNQEKVDKAKKQIKTLVIGLVIIIAAYALSSWVVRLLVSGSGSLVQ